jgi:putative spermidine/putrescine transport system substrate-binding protein
LASRPRPRSCCCQEPSRRATSWSSASAGPSRTTRGTALFQGYAKATNQPVKDDVYNGEMAKVYSMVKSGDVTYDVIMVEAPELVRGCEDGVFEKMDWNVVKRDKFIQGGTTACGAGSVLWGVTLFYDPAKVPNGPDTYAKLWDVKTYPASACCANRPRRRSRSRCSPTAWRPATSTRCSHACRTEARVRQADQIKPSLMWWKSGTQPVQMIASGDATYAVGFTGASCARTKAARSIRCSGRRCSTRSTTGRW